MPTEYITICKSNDVINGARVDIVTIFYKNQVFTEPCNMDFH